MKRMLRQGMSLFPLWKQFLEVLRTATVRIIMDTLFSDPAVPKYLF